MDDAQNLEGVPNSKQLDEFKMYKATYFPDTLSYIYLTNVNDENLSLSFQWVTENLGPEDPIFFAMQNQTYRNSSSEKEIRPTVFQFGTNKRVLIVQYQEDEHPNATLLADFIKSRKILGTKQNSDIPRLQRRFGIEFTNYVDFKLVYLSQFGIGNDFIYGKSIINNLMEKAQIIPTADFYNKKIVLTPWDKSNLKSNQVLHVSFEIVAYYMIYLYLAKKHPDAEKTFKVFELKKEIKKEKKR